MVCEGSLKMETKDKSILKKRGRHKKVMVGKVKPAWEQVLDHSPRACWKMARLLCRYLEHNRL